MPERTDAEINARLAEAMGWSTGSPPGAAIDDWDPLNDIRHAVEIDVMMWEKGWNLYLVRHQDYVAATYAKKGSNQREHRAPTPARAIALAALAALEKA